MEEGTTLGEGEENEQLLSEGHFKGPPVKESLHKKRLIRWKLVISGCRLRMTVMNSAQ